MAMTGTWPVLGFFPALRLAIGPLVVAGPRRRAGDEAGHLSLTATGTAAIDPPTSVKDDRPRSQGWLLF